MDHSKISPPNPVYHLAPSIRLHWAAWDEEYVVFEETSGQTHQMDPVRAFVLHTIAEKAVTFDELQIELAAAPGLDGMPDLGNLLATVLLELDTQGLVEADPQ